MTQALYSKLRMSTSGLAWAQAMCRDYYTLEFMDPSVDTSPIAPALAAFFDDVLDRSVSQLNFKVPTLLLLVEICAASWVSELLGDRSLHGRCGSSCTR